MAGLFFNSLSGLILEVSIVHVRFGKCNEITGLSHDFGGYVFTPANVRLARPAKNETQPVIASCLADIAAIHFLEKQISGGSAGCDAPWARGRIQSLFNLQQNPDVLFGDTWFDEKTFHDKGFMYFEFLCTVVDRGFEIGIPFTCASWSGRSELDFGYIPVRNGSTYSTLVKQISDSFWKFLLTDPGPIRDYGDIAKLLEIEIEFGVRSNVPYCHWPE